MNSISPDILPASLKDLAQLQAFLKENKLRTSIFIDEQSLYFYLTDSGKIIGMIGAEINPPYALIRAAGIAPEYRKQGIARLLFKRLAQELQEKRIDQLYLFSRQAPEFWTKMGFSRCEIQEVIDVLSSAHQVQEFIADQSIWTDVAWKRALEKSG